MKPKEKSVIEKGPVYVSCDQSSKCTRGRLLERQEFPLHPHRSAVVIMVPVSQMSVGRPENWSRAQKLSHIPTQNTLKVQRIKKDLNVALEAPFVRPAERKTNKQTTKGLKYCPRSIGLTASVAVSPGNILKFMEAC